jgi:hypothetical protein
MHLQFDGLYEGTGSATTVLRLLLSTLHLPSFSPRHHQTMLRKAALVAWIKRLMKLENLYVTDYERLTSNQVPAAAVHKGGWLLERGEAMARTTRHTGSVVILKT